MLRYFLIGLLLFVFLGCGEENSIDNKIVKFDGVVFPDLFQTGYSKGDSIVFDLPYGTNVSRIKTHFLLKTGQTTSEMNDQVFDFSKPQTILVKEGKMQHSFVVKVNVSTQPEVAVHGVWISNVGSNALSSPENIDYTVNKLDELGFNAAFVVVYNKSKTLFPSQVLKNTLNATTVDDVQIYPGWDPLKVFIEKAHAKGIKVIAWFEYGFASHYSGLPSPLIDNHPEWAARDVNGNITLKSNFYWLNGFLPEVQKYMIDLISELVRNYQVDGIQGDDRMPSMPINSGYDAATIQLYQNETGKTIPYQDNDSGWMQWRADKLTDFGGKLYQSVKAIRPNCVVAFAPGIYKWSYQNYLQQWDKWLQKGIVDIISPQLYRYENQGLETYSSLINLDLSDILNKNATFKNKYCPGILIQSSGYNPSDDYLARCIHYNRSKGILGEIMFYYEGIEYNKKVFKAFYPVKAIFPTISN